MSVKRARVRQVVVELVRLRIHCRQMRQPMLVVKQCSPVKRFLAEFRANFRAELHVCVNDPHGDVYTAGRGTGQEQQEIAESGVSGSKGRGRGKCKIC